MTPALRARFDEHRHIRQSELYELASLLDTYELTPDATPLRDAASLCLGASKTAHADAPDAGRQYWGYRIDSLQLRLGEQRHCRPRRARIKSLVGYLSVEVQEYLPEDPDDVENNFRQIRLLDAQFWCDANATFGAKTHRLRAAWHVDTHIHTNTKSSAVHPRFHFQVGGHDLDEIDHTIRGALLLDAPRPALAPLDGILAVDFVLSHYGCATWDKLRKEARYGRLRSPSMKRYWKPYFRLLADALDGEDAVLHGSDAALLLPNLVVD